uniref:zinc finger C3H1 domain-containing protein-like isoform X2 n=1 Tax=Myxine glutinosa TaxID=7769 RepID=UPI00358DE239
MPSNIFLAVRLCVALVQEGSLHQLAAQAKQLAQRLSYCLCIWKIAVAAEIKCGRRKTTRWLFREALHRLPLCANLWKDRLLFEAAIGAKKERLQRIVAQCEVLGVNLGEILVSSSEIPGVRRRQPDAEGVGSNSQLRP